MSEFASVVHGRLDPVKNRRAAGERLKTAARAATANRPVRVEHHVPHLAGRPGGAGQEHAVGDDTRADAGAEKNADHVVGLGLELEPVNAGRGHVAVVAEPDGAAKLRLEVGLERDVTPIEVRGEQHVRLVAADRAGRADAHTAGLCRVDAG